MLCGPFPLTIDCEPFLYPAALVLLYWPLLERLAWLERRWAADPIVGFGIPECMPLETSRV